MLNANSAQQPLIGGRQLSCGVWLPLNTDGEISRRTKENHVIYISTTPVDMAGTQLAPWSEGFGAPESNNHKEGPMTPTEELAYLNAELERVGNEHSDTPRVLRLTDNCLRQLSKWKWEQCGWTINDGQACGIRNGNEQSRRTALMSVLKGHIDEVEFVSGLEMLEVVLGASSPGRA